MEIKDHLLTGKDVKYVPSPNFSGKFPARLPDTIVLHYTAGSSKESSVKTLTSKESGASAHLVVGRDGTVTQLVPFDTVAWHAGKSTWHDRTGLNGYSIGIEMDNAGRLTRAGDSFNAWFGRSYPQNEVMEATHRNETTPAFWHLYTEAQIETVQLLCQLLIGTYGIKEILGHEEISPGRKCDPGPAFPLDKIRERILICDRSSSDSAASMSPEVIGLVNTEKLNIRTGPSLNAPVAAPPLQKGTIVGVGRESNGWYEVTKTVKGWVKKEYIKTASG